MRQVYLDANVVMPLISNQKDDDKDRQDIRNTLKTFEDSPDVEFVMSHFTILETVKVLRVKRKFASEDLHKIYNELALKSRLEGIKIKIVDFSPDDGYDFTEMFYDLHLMLLVQKNGIEDATHAIIMKNNGIQFIMTLNEKDFTIPGFTVINPRKVSEAIVLGTV